MSIPDNTIQCHICGSDMNAELRVCPNCETLIKDLNEIITEKQVKGEIIQPQFKNQSIVEQTNFKDESTITLHYLNPGFIEDIGPFIHDHAIYFIDSSSGVSGKIYIDGLDVRKLLLAGITKWFSLKDGKIVLHVHYGDIGYMVWRGFHDEVISIYEALPDQHFLRRQGFLKCYYLYLKGDMQEALSVFAKCSKNEFINPFFFHYYCLNDVDYAKELVSNNPGYSLWVYRYVFNDNKKCNESNNLIYEVDYLYSAYIWKSIFENDEKARESLMLYENSSENIEYFDLGIAWKSILNDELQTRRCINRHITNVRESSVLWFSDLYFWKLLFKDSEIRQLLINEESKINELLMRENEETYENDNYPNIDIEDYYLVIAEGWKKLLNDSEESMRCLLKAEEYNTSVYFNIVLAQSWRDLFDSRHEYFRLIQEAIKLAESENIFTGYLSIAEELGPELNKYRDIYNSKKYAYLAESHAHDNRDMEQIISFWRDIIHDDEEAERCKGLQRF